jgi:putative phytanoyl-coA dioxygenase
MQINGKKIFNKGTLLFRLCLMASLELQEKNIAHPTLERYLSPGEMVDMLYFSCEQALEEEFKFCFLHYERDTLKELVELMDKYLKDGSLLEGIGEYLVYHNKSWIEVRELALKTIHIFGYELDDFDYDPD